MKIKLLYILVALVLFSSCDLLDKKESYIEGIKLKENTIPNILHKGGDITIIFSAGCDWYAGLKEINLSGEIVSPQWCRIKNNQSGRSGENLKITIEVDAQYSNNYASRYAAIVLKSSDHDEDEKNLNITQDGVASILVNPKQDSYKSFNHNENGFNVDVTKAIDEISIIIKDGENPNPNDDTEATWIKVGEPNLPPDTSKKQADPEVTTDDVPNYETLGFILEPNNTPYERYATIFLTYKDITSKITIFQHFSENEISIPKGEFKKFLISYYDRNNDRKLSDVEAAIVSYMDCANIAIGSMEGIEYFTNLTSLICRNSSVGYLDLSKNTKLTNLDCSENNLMELNITNNIELKSLICNSNSLKDIDITNNTKLEEFFCNDNLITKFDLSKNTNLKYFDCSAQRDIESALTSLDLSKNIELITLSCSSTELFTLDLSQNVNLQTLYCNRTNMTEIDLSSNINLMNLSVSNIKSLDLSHNTNLSYFSASDLKSLDLSNNKELKNLHLSLYGTLKHLDLSNNNKLKKVDLDNYYLRTIDLTGASELEVLKICYTSSNMVRGKLSKLDIPDSPKLAQLWCQNQSLKELNLFNNPVLTNLQCHYNLITKLNVSECPLLEELYCWGNVLSTLDLSNNRSLTDLNCANNRLKELNVCRTNLSNSKSIQPLDCSRNDDLATLYLKEGWKINSINVARDDSYIPSLTEVKYEK